MVGPVAKRVAVGWLVDAQQTSLRRACRVVDLSTTTWRYERRGRGDNTHLLARLQFHAAARPRYGYRRLHVLVEREGVHANHKRVHRVYRQGGLQVRRRQRKRLTRGARVPLTKPTAPLERWSMDFVADTLGDRRGFRPLNIVDDFSHECPAIEVDRSLPGARVVRVLDRLAETTGLPKVIVCDNGPEFAGRTLDAWAYRRGVELRFIRPGKPIENAFVESFNGKFRDECLNEHAAASLARATDAGGVCRSRLRQASMICWASARLRNPARAPLMGGAPARRLLRARPRSLDKRRDSHYPCSGFGGPVREAHRDACSPCTANHDLSRNQCPVTEHAPLISQGGRAQRTGNSNVAPRGTQGPDLDYSEQESRKYSRVPADRRGRLRCSRQKSANHRSTDEDWILRWRSRSASGGGPRICAQAIGDKAPGRCLRNNRLGKVSKRSRRR